MPGAGILERHRPIIERYIEVASVILLSATTVASAYSAYTASRWSGIQTFRLAAANEAREERVLVSDVHAGFIALETEVLLAYFEAMEDGDEELSAFLLRRLRPDAKRAFEAWMKTDPLQNAKAPASPFVMEQFHPRELTRMRELEATARRFSRSAAAANHTSDLYVLLTVLFAAVLFFAGIGSKLQGFGTRVAMMIVGTTIFVSTLGALLTLPFPEG